MRELLIRPAEPSDAQQVINRIANSWGDTHLANTPNPSEEWIHTMHHDMRHPDTVGAYHAEIRHASLRPDDATWQVAFSGDRCVGVMHGRTRTEDRESTQWLDKLHVAGDWQGTELSTSLMEGFLDWADQSRMSKLRVFVYNLQAIRFYERFGFAMIPDAFGDIDGVTTRFMSRPALAEVSS
jgi:GNAT superfamily N-acetyltransferase